MAGESEEGGLHAFHLLALMAMLAVAACRCCWSSLSDFGCRFPFFTYQLLISSVAEVSSASYFPEISVEWTTLLTHG